MLPVCIYSNLQPKPQGSGPSDILEPLGFMSVCYLRGFMGSPAVLVAVEAGQ